MYVREYPNERVSVDFGDGSINEITNSLTTTSLEMSVGMGQIDGASSLDKFGVNPEITTNSDPEDIWEFGGQYIYDTNGTAPIISLVSDDPDDTENISVTGLDINGYEVIQIIQLNGNIRVALSTPLWRVYRMSNEGTNNLEGTVYCYTSINNVPLDNEVRAIINGSHNQTLMTLYTVPKGKVGFLVRGELGVELEGNAGTLSEYAHMHYESRRYGKVFKVKKAVTCMVGGNAVYQDRRSFPDVIPSLTDIRLRVIEVTETMGIWGTFDMLLMDEDKFSSEYLAAIGQQI